MDKDTLAEVYANAYMYKCEVCEREGLSRDEVHRCKEIEEGEYICDRCNKEEMNFGVTPDFKKRAKGEEA